MPRKSQVSIQAWSPPAEAPISSCSMRIRSRTSRIPAGSIRFICAGKKSTGPRCVTDGSRSGKRPPRGASGDGTHSPPRRGGVDALSEAKAQTGWSDRRNVSAELTTPALRASPPLRGGEYLFPPHVSHIANLSPPSYNAATNWGQFASEGGYGEDVSSVCIRVFDHF